MNEELREAQASEYDAIAAVTAESETQSTGDMQTYLRALVDHWHSCAAARRSGGALPMMPASRARAAEQREEQARAAAADPQRRSVVIESRKKRKCPPGKTSFDLAQETRAWMANADPHAGWDDLTDADLRRLSARLYCVWTANHFCPTCVTLGVDQLEDVTVGIEWDACRT